MTLVNRQASYSINVGKDNPATVGRWFMIIGAVIGFWSVFAALLAKGVITMSQDSLIALVSLFSGGVTLILILSFTLPIFKKAASSIKVSGKILDVKSEEIRASQNGTTPVFEKFTPIVEYEVSGKSYKTELISSSSVCPKIGSAIELNVSKKDPTKILTNGNVVFAAFSAVIFTAAAVLFALPGIRIIMGKSSGFSTSSTIVTGTQEAKEYSTMALLIGGGLGLLFFLIGLGICINLKKKSSSKKLMETGIKKEGFIVQVSVNENVIVNGKNPVKLSCSVDGKIIPLKANFEIGNCQFRESQKIDIYFDPEDENRFYADL